MAQKVTVEIVEYTWKTLVVVHINPGLTYPEKTGEVHRSEMLKLAKEAIGKKLECPDY